MTHVRSVPNQLLFSPYSAVLPLVPLFHNYVGRGYTWKWPTRTHVSLLRPLSTEYGWLRTPGFKMSGVVFEFLKLNGYRILMPAVNMSRAIPAKRVLQQSPSAALGS